MMDPASSQSGQCPPRVPLHFPLPVPTRPRVLKPGDVYVRCGTPPLAAHRVSSPIQLTRSVALQPCRTPSPVRRLDVREVASPSPARLLCRMPSPPLASPNPSPCRRSPSPVMRPLPASPRQLVRWQAPPQRPVRLSPIVTTRHHETTPPVDMRTGFTTYRAQPLPGPLEGTSSPEQLSDISGPDEVGSSATTAVSPQTPDTFVCDPQGPPPQRPVRSSQPERQCEKDRQDDLQRLIEEKDHQIHSLRSLAASTAEELETARLRLTCIVCADADVQCIFQPCHHVVCCLGCAGHCEMCPVCRTSVQSVAPVYLP
eukprot:g19523.t1